MDLKVINSVLGELQEERGISRESVMEAIEEALAHAYKKEYGKRGQIVRAKFDITTGTTTFEQVKEVVDESTVRFDEDEDEEAVSKVDESHPNSSERETTSPRESEDDDGDERARYNPEHHMLLEDAQKIKKGVKAGDELVFPLEEHEDFGRIAAQTAKQVMIQKIREAEKSYLSEEFGKREGEIVTGTVQRIERGNIFIDLGRAVGILPYEEQIPSERYKQGERVRGFLYRVEETPRGVFLRLSRSHPQFLEKLFELEAPEVANGVVEIKAIAREAGSRSKVAVYSNDDHVDPVGSLVGQRGVRVSTVMSELGGEKIDIIEWSEDPEQFIEDSLSPAKVVEVEIERDEQRALVKVTEDQQSLAIGRGGQNVRLAAKLTGWRIDIQSIEGETVVAEENELRSDKSGRETDDEKVEVPEVPEKETEEVKSEKKAEQENSDKEIQKEEK